MFVCTTLPGMSDHALPLATESRGVEVSELPCRSVLNRSVGSRVHMDLTINPYRGCEFGCRYCYARYSHEFLDRTPEEFETRIFAKLDAPRVLAAELARMKVAGRKIAIGTATDPYQPIERELRVTRGILEALCGCRGAHVSLITKSGLVTRDIDLFRKLHERHHLSVALTLITLDRAMQRKLEPRAPTPEKRLAAIRELADAGLRVGVSYSPLMPGVNDSQVDIDGLLAAAAEAGAAFAYGQVLWVPSCARPFLFEWLREQFRERVWAYRRLYEHGVDPPEAVRAGILRRFEAARDAAGLAGRGMCEEEGEAVQMVLFG
ncbi:MAG: radical SAM protein [Armatimonadetes bacterium]|nr:radical SAM protein [Armatimonadota bacterium]